MEYLTDKIIISTLIIVLWAANLIYLLQVEVSPEKWNLIPQFLLQILLYTGLFITAHDAMHGVVSFRNPTLNKFIGQLSLILFALFSLKKLLPKHKEHHANPASGKDPDYVDDHRARSNAYPVWLSFLQCSVWLRSSGHMGIQSHIIHIYNIAIFLLIYCLKFNILFIK